MTRSFSSSPPRGTGTPQQPRDVFNRLVSDRNKERVAENVDLFKKYWDLLTWNNVKRGVSEAIDELLKVQNRARLLAALGVIGTLGTSYIIFSEQIRSFFGRETAEVAREVLKNEGLQDQTLELANAAVRTVLNDPEVRSRFMAFLRDTASSPDTQNALVSLSLNILQHPDVLKDAVGLGKEVWLQLVSDPETLDQLTVVLAQALADERSKEAVVGLIQRLAADDQVLAAVLELLNRLFAEPEVQQSVHKLLTESSHAVLNDDSIAEHSRQFVSEVVSDAEVQRTGGEALWSTVTYSVEPTMNKVFGFGFFITSLALAHHLFSF